MKSKKLFYIMTTIMLILVMVACAACGKKPVDPIVDPDPDPDTTVYGLPTPAVGRYIKDADIVQDGTSRYLVYTTNSESGEEDNVIAVRKGTFNTEKGWAYGEEKIAVEADSTSWDKNIGSASIVKGDFSYDDTDYAWMIAYCATSKSNETGYQIGLALATAPDAQWVKVGDAPIIAFDSAVYGSSSIGCYAPSLINMDKASVVRIFYTYADIYGHFSSFVDINAEVVDDLFAAGAANDVNLISGSVQLPTNGSIAGGDAETMFPNADFAYDAVNGKVYAVKDYSPSASTNPKFADRIQLISIDESELYTVELLNGWEGLELWDNTDTPEMAYERLYSACIVSDAFGHMLATTEIIYNVCDLEADNADYIFSQKLLTFVVTAD